jgi:hypothetical protein
MPGPKTVGIAPIAKETGLIRQAVYRIKATLWVLRLLWMLGGCDLRRPLQAD